MNNASTLDTTSVPDMAKYYVANGLVVFPVITSRDGAKTAKRPLVHEWQKLRMSDMHRILPLFTSNVNAIGVPTGEVNGLYVLDDDGGDLRGKALPLTPTVKTGRGQHFWYAYKQGMRNTVNADLHIDTRGEGGFVVVPPSWHHLGAYEWVVEFDGHHALADAPQWLLDMATQEKDTAHRRTQMLARVNGVGEGGRNQAAAQILGHVLSHMHEALWLDFAWKGIQEWNERNMPPMSNDELYRVFISIASREKRKRDRMK
jgi:hypothetical protein